MHIPQFGCICPIQVCRVSYCAINWIITSPTTSCDILENISWRFETCDPYSLGEDGSECDSTGKGIQFANEIIRQLKLLKQIKESTAYVSRHNTRFQEQHEVLLPLKIRQEFTTFFKIFKHRREQSLYIDYSLNISARHKCLISFKESTRIIRMARHSVPSPTITISLNKFILLKPIMYNLSLTEQCSLKFVFFVETDN